VAQAAASDAAPWEDTELTDEEGYPLRVKEAPVGGSDGYRPMVNTAQGHRTETMEPQVNGRAVANGTGAAVPAAAPGSAAVAGNGSRALHEGDTVRIRVEETGRQAEDRYMLEDVVRVLLEFKGRSSVTLEVKTSGRVVRLDMPFATVDPCEELEKRLCELVGRENVSMPVGAGQG
jgi:hypothetical protein